ncbi:hypothetical protein BDFB_006393 [Asbolus verrucosus]|uniref:7tm 6 domain containing protein n=1 Tax=Asbolus verrucosus TaxID=1661398 RepID=A0A482VX39_ASBVE|nr:hypothetical protein BDFB_006393 [Asbolus verrucosus]
MDEKVCRIKCCLWLQIFIIILYMVQFFSTELCFDKVVPFSSEFFSLISYANAVLVEVFMYCWFGNELELKVKKKFRKLFSQE